MADVFTSAKRSAIMARIKGQNTKPEILVRKLVHSLGYRFRLHQNKFPGKPDLVLARHEKMIFVNGCFWHGHAGCSRATAPSTNIDFWQRKIQGNKKRDLSVRRKLRRKGWKILVVWQCQTRSIGKLREQLKCFFEE